MFEIYLFHPPKKKLYLAPIEMTNMFFPTEFIQILRLRVMLNKIWAIVE